MAAINVSRLSDELNFGARIRGVDLKALQDEKVRNELVDVFEKRGVVVFEDMEPSADLHLALSEVFGPLEHHAMTEDKSSKPQVVNLKQQQDVVEADGKLLAAFLPWHFDACYNDKINRAAVLRPIELPPEGGMTGFADGIQLYKAISRKMRDRIADKKVIYHAKLMFMHQRFGFPKNHRWVSISDSAAELLEKCEGARRSVHPTVWRRASGEHVLHVSPWQAAGLYGYENPEGDALLEELCQEIYSKMTPYWHEWKLTDMVLWDNWRFIHAVSGNDPKYARHMQRATIRGDYGLGFFEEGAEGSAPPAMD